MKKTMEIPSSLPRSIRWRLQLGLLKMPEAQADGDEDTSFLESLVSTNNYLLQDQRERFNTLFLRYDRDRYPRHLEESNDEPSLESDDEEVDPLTQILQQQEARQAKEARQRRRFRKSSMVDTSMSQEILQVVKKDLNRLHNEHAQYFQSRANWKSAASGDGDPLDFEAAVEERNERLTQLLHIYGRAHILPGYQQGMHEICSYVMFVMEMDLFDVETQECKDYVGLLDDEYLVHDVFSVTESIITKMELAFGFDSRKSKGAKPVEAMGDSILFKVQYVARDKKLYMHLQHMEFHLELYCARWVRLLFAREAGGWRNVLALWDIFFDCITAAPSITSMPTNKYTRPGLDPPLQLGTFSLMTVLETAAASLLWMSRDHLQSHQPDEGLQALCSMDPMKDQRPLISTLLSSLRRLQISSNMAPLLPPPPSPKSRPTMNRRGSFSGGLVSLVSDVVAPPANLSPNSGRKRSTLRRRSSLQHVSMQEAVATVPAPPPPERSSGYLGSILSSVDIFTSPPAPSANRKHHLRRGSFSGGGGSFRCEPSTAPTPIPPERRMRRRSSLQHVAVPMVTQQIADDSISGNRKEEKKEEEPAARGDSVVSTFSRTMSRLGSMRGFLSSPVTSKRTLDIDSSDDSDFLKGDSSHNNNCEQLVSQLEGDVVAELMPPPLLQHDDDEPSSNSEASPTSPSKEEDSGNLSLNNSLRRKANMEMLLSAQTDLDQSSLFQESSLFDD